jgi:hypothetical protein
MQQQIITEILTKNLYNNLNKNRKRKNIISVIAVG